MSKLILAIILLVTCIGSAAGQVKRTIKIDSSTIEITTDSYFAGTPKRMIYSHKTIREYFNKNDIVLETDYYEDTVTIRSIGHSHKSNHGQLDDIHIYNRNGNLEIALDFINRTWLPADTNRYPNYTVLNAARRKGDSIIESLYGKQFFKEHVKWDMMDSYYFDAGSDEPSFLNEWINNDSAHTYQFRATEFDIVYDLDFRKRGIQIILDKSGQLLPRHGWNENWTICNQGLEILEKNNKTGFKLYTNEAIQLAKQHGLSEKDSNNVSCYLEWVPIKDSENLIFNGHFRMLVKQYVPGVCLRGKRKSYVIRRQYHNIWEFNPWTKQYMGKRKSYEQYLDGLVPPDYSANRRKRERAAKLKPQ